MAEKMTRRTFMKSAAAAAAAISLSGVLVGCGAVWHRMSTDRRIYRKSLQCKGFLGRRHGHQQQQLYHSHCTADAGHEKQHLCFAAVSGHVCGHHW